MKRTAFRGVDRQRQLVEWARLNSERERGRLRTVARRQGLPIPNDSDDTDNPYSDDKETQGE